jgi:hypothetical protein
MNAPKHWFNPRYMRARLLVGAALNSLIFLGLTTSVPLGKDCIGCEHLPGLCVSTWLASVAIIILLPVLMRGSPKQRAGAIVLLLIPVIFGLSGWASFVSIYV